MSRSLVARRRLATLEPLIATPRGPLRREIVVIERRHRHGDGRCLDEDSLVDGGGVGRRGRGGWRRLSDGRALDDDRASQHDRALLDSAIVVGQREAVEERAPEVRLVHLRRHEPISEQRHTLVLQHLLGGRQVVLRGKWRCAVRCRRRRAGRLARTSSVKSKLSGTGWIISSSLHAERESRDFHMPGAESAIGSSSASLEACAPISAGREARSAFCAAGTPNDASDDQYPDIYLRVRSTFV